MELPEAEINTAMKIFGRNASEFLSNSVGTVLAVVNIALAAWDIATTSDPLEKTLDSLNIVSASLSIIGISAGWISGSILSADVVDLGAAIFAGCMEIVAAWAGPLSAAFAVGGWSPHRFEATLTDVLFLFFKLE
jgi:hypothetical protein